MATEQRRQQWPPIVLAVLLVILAALGYRAFVSTPAAPEASSPARAAAGRTAAGKPQAPTAPDVHLRALEEDRPKPGPAERNLFRFKEKAAPPPPTSRPAPAVEARPVPVVPAGPPPPPPIPLKFIGIVDDPQHAHRIAALVDPMGYPFHGAEGDVIAGQYRILKIGVESIEMAYLDGRGRQTIRLSGS